MTPFTPRLIDCYGPLTPIYNELASESQYFTLFHIFDGEEITMTITWDDDYQ